jgi:hypothetical protein
MRPIWKKMPLRSTTSFMARVSPRESAGGFSQNVGRFRSAAATTMSRWVWVGLAITTASTCGSSSSLSGSV